MDTLTGLSQMTASENIFGTLVSVTTNSRPYELTDHTTEGFVAGGGIDLSVRRIHLLPEIRYTRWGNHFSGRFGVQSKQNQVEFLVGVTF